MMRQAIQHESDTSRPDCFIPKELLTKCVGLVESIHIDAGVQNIPARMRTKQNMVALAVVDDRVMSMLGTATFGWKLRIAMRVCSPLIVGLAWAFTWWILLGLVAVVVLDPILTRRTKRSWRFLAAVLLSLEVLVNDVAGWGTAYPEAQIRALQALGLQTQWLELYLPTRTSADAMAFMESFAPGKGE